MRRNFLLIALSTLLFTSVLLLSTEKASANSFTDQDIYQFLQESHQKQIDQHTKSFYSKSEIQDALGSHFTREYSQFFIEEMFWFQDGAWRVIPTDYLIGYVPDFSYNGETKIEYKGNHIIVSEFFPANDYGPVSWEAHTQTVTIAYSTKGLIIKNIHSYIDNRSFAEIYIYEKLLISDQSAVIENGRTLVPLRSIFESLGSAVEWDPTVQGITIKTDNDEIELFLGKKEAIVNNKTFSLDVGPKSVNNRTLIPLRFIAQNIGADVKWDEDTKTVIIESRE